MGSVGVMVGVSAEIFGEASVQSKDVQISGMSWNTKDESSHDPPESPLRYVDACNKPPVPFSTEVEFRPSRALSTPAP